jgi:hypothetical protein
MLFGEIDCREGILVSVEKCRYEVCQVSHSVMCANKPWSRMLHLPEPSVPLS